MAIGFRRAYPSLLCPVQDVASSSGQGGFLTLVVRPVDEHQHGPHDKVVAVVASTVTCVRSRCLILGMGPSPFASPQFPVT